MPGVTLARCRFCWGDERVGCRGETKGDGQRELGDKYLPAAIIVRLVGEGCWGDHYTWIQLLYLPSFVSCSPLNSLTFCLAARGLVKGRPQIKRNNPSGTQLENGSITSIVHFTRGCSWGDWGCMKRSRKCWQTRLQYLLPSTNLHNDLQNVWVKILKLLPQSMVFKTHWERLVIEATSDTKSKIHKIQI